MSDSKRRTVGERGQVTIPKEFRDRFGISGGDDVVIREDSGKLVIELPVSREQLAEGYRQRSERAQDLADELRDVSREADDQLGDAPEW
jgi:AbrB family looped-hinge helix DNA binding protein